MKLKIKIMAAAVVALVASAEANDAVWTNKTNSSQTWNLAANWMNGYIGGTTAANADDINFAYPFNTADGSRYGQPINLDNFQPSFHSVTGLPFQVITRASSRNGKLTVVDPSAFRGVWATAGYYTQYIVSPESGKTAEFQRVAHEYTTYFKVAAGGKARVRDLLGKGYFLLADAGELVLNTPRTLGTRALLRYSGTTLTIESPDEPAMPAPAAGASWRFDAAATDTLKTYYNEEDGRTYVTNWCDANGGAAMAYAPFTVSSPFISPVTVNGHHLVDFGAYKNNSRVYVPSGADELYGPAAFMLVGKTNNLSVAYDFGTDVCEMFVVVKVHTEVSSADFQSVLGHYNQYQIPMLFKTGNMFNATYSRTTYGREAGNEGDYRAWLNGEPYIGGTLNDANSLTDVSRWNPTQLNIIAVNFKGGTRPTLVALGTQRHGDEGRECGGFAMAEAIIYKTELTDAERRQTIEYLKRKWLSGVESKPFDMDAAIISDATAKLNVEAGNTAKLRTLRRAANISSGNIVKTGDGTLEVEEILPHSATLEVRGGCVMLSHDTPAASTDRANVTTDGMLCWLDSTSSGAFETDGSGGITKWKDCRDGYSSTVFAANVNGSATSLPATATDSTSGLTVVDFGDEVATTAPYAKITVNEANMENVQETFIVWKRNGSGVPGIFSGSDADGAKRDSNSRRMHPDSNSGYAVAMLWNVDGCPIDSGLINSATADFTDVGNGRMAVVNGSSQRKSKWCYLALNANSGNKGGGCAIGEVIAYNRQLTDAERRNVTAYLMNKWENGATLGLDTDDTVTKIAFTGGAAPKVGTKTDRTVTSITGSGTLTKTGAGKLTVTSLDSGVTALDIKEGEIKCGSIANVTEISTWLDADGNIGTVSLGSAVTLPAAMTVNVAIDPEFNGKADYPIVKAESYASTPDISGWTLNVTGVTGGEFSLVRSSGGICLRSGVRGLMMIIK